MSRTGKSRKTENTLVVDWGFGPGGGEVIERKCGMTANGNGVSFRGDENVLRLIVVMVVQYCECTKNQ